jgi:hypothetical protein
MLPNIRKNIALFEVTHALNACASDKMSVTMKTNMEHWWTDNDSRKLKPAKKKK